MRGERGGWGRLTEVRRGVKSDILKKENRGASER